MDASIQLPQFVSAIWDHLVGHPCYHPKNTPTNLNYQCARDTKGGGGLCCWFLKSSVTEHCACCALQHELVQEESFSLTQQIKWKHSQRALWIPTFLGECFGAVAVKAVGSQRRGLGCSYTKTV
eukprot:5852591-Amphidinium_carterae.1